MASHKTAFDYQKRAIEFICKMIRNLLLIAPMGAGKTRVAMAALKHFGKGAIVSQYRALVWQHYQTMCDELEDVQDDDIAIGTADYSLGPALFKKSKYRAITLFRLIALAVTVRDFHIHCPVVIVDEIDDLSSWYQIAITLLLVLHPKVKIIAMTGTMHENDIPDVAKWLNAEVIKSEETPTDMHHHLVRFETTSQSTTKVLVNGKEEMELPEIIDRPELAAAAIYRLIRKTDGKLAMFFSHRREMARRVCSALTEVRRETLTTPLELGFPDVPAQSSSLRRLREGLPFGIALHHAGESFPHKAQNFVSRLMRENRLDACSACFTFLRGVDLPIRHLVLSSIFDTDEFQDPPALLTNSAAMQLFGRAGRIRYETEGHAWIPVYSKTEETLVRRVLLGGGASLINRSLGNQSRIVAVLMSLIYRRQDSVAKLKKFLKRSLWGVGKSHVEIDAAFNEAFAEITQNAQTRLVKVDHRDHIEMTDEGEIAGRLNLHPMELDVVRSYAEESIDFSDFVSLLAEAYKEMEGVDLGDDYKLVLEKGMAARKPGLRSDIINFAEYVGRTLEKCELYLKALHYSSGDEIGEWRSRVLKPYICGGLPLANVLYDVVGRRVTKRLVRNLDRIMAKNADELQSEELAALAGLIFTRGATPNNDYLGEVAEALGITTDELQIYLPTHGKEVSNV